MFKPTPATLLACLLAMLPVMGNAQVCQTASIPATTPTTQFSDHGDGTVTDNKTGLMWKKCAEGQDPLECSGVSSIFTWPTALQRAQTVNGGMAGSNLGYTDWRVPNIKELASIVEEQCHAPSINLTVFPDAYEEGGSEFCSASPSANVSYHAWYVEFYNGHNNRGHKLIAYRVRLVRGGQ